MTERERLIALLWGAIPEKKDAEDTADYLLANGVIVPPCKVGDKVYFAHRFECRITEHKVENLYMGKRGMSIRVENLANPLKPYEIGKTVFLTKEEAEQALNGGGK